MKKYFVFAVCFCLIMSSSAFAIGGNKAAYIGGTTEDFKGAKKNIEGTLSLEDEKEMKFTHKFGNKAGTLSIPYENVVDIEYGHKTGRRVGAAIATAILISPVGLFLLFSKKRQHFVTIGYTDAEGKEQVAVFELGKDLPRTMLPMLEARTGKKITYQEGSGKDKDEKSKEKAKAPAPSAETPAAAQ